MMQTKPIIICRLCNKEGRILNAYDNNSISFTELTPRYTRRIPSIAGKALDISLAEILIEGYVSVSIDGWNLSAPVRFSIVQRIFICAPGHAVLRFTVNNFICQAVPLRYGLADFIRIMINVETRVSSYKEKKLNTGEASSTHINDAMDTIRMLSRTCLIRRIDRVKAEIYQYTAISDGNMRIFTNADEIKGYGGKGILSPEEVSYYNLYVNGVLQPKVNYIMKKGRLELVTDDLPTQGATVIVKYITFEDKNGFDFIDDQYFTIADGTKREYTNNDALKKYSTNGIPGPNEVSYYNLYVNGVLQPKKNYIVRKGLIKFLTEEIPQEGRTIILESIAIKDACGRFLEVEDYQYDVLANESRAYCSGGDITPYGEGILSPQLTSYQNLTVNAVNQPDINSQVTNNCLVFRTVDLPTAGSPVTLQSVRVLNKRCCARPANICMCLCLAAYWRGFG